ncbi:MAG: acyltransferase family protein [Phascolarctobacterium sp.]|nr:acyltransferase family protein [Phascolarctobacterium sp.]
MKRIEELDMIKGLLITFVVTFHCSLLVGTLGLWGSVGKMMLALAVPSMFVFMMASGIVYKFKGESVAKEILQRCKSLLDQYYLYSIPMLIVYFIVYVLVAGRSLGWFADGLISILCHYQGVHLFSDAPIVHEMFYGTWSCWYLFQVAAAYIVFIPVQHILVGKPRQMQILSALLLLGLGAIFYILDLQGLNGKFFPMTTKIFILPNIFGFAGVLTIGKCLSEYNVGKLTHAKVSAKISTIVITMVLLFVFYLLEDYLYDLPIGKWGPFQAWSYFYAPICGLTLFFFLFTLCNFLKSKDSIKKLLGFFGQNSLLILITHEWVMWFVQYVGGFWYPYVTVPIPLDDPVLCNTNFFILLGVTSLILIPYIMLRNKWKNASKTRGICG